MEGVRLQWTDHDGRVYTGEKDRMMELALKAKRNDTLKVCGMFIPKDYLTKESTMTPSTPTATMSCIAGCDTTHFGYDGVVGFDYCRDCGAVAGYSFGTAPQSAAQPTPPAPSPRRAESLAHLVEETDRQVQRGDFIRVVSAGPKSQRNIGKVGHVFWTGQDRYKPGQRLGVNVENETEETLWVNSNDVIIEEN
mgnify:CR=1 FL=1